MRRERFGLARHRRVVVIRLLVRKRPGGRGRMPRSAIGCCSLVERLDAPKMEAAAGGRGGAGEARPEDPPALARADEGDERHPQGAARADPRGAPRSRGGGQPGGVEGDDRRAGDPAHARRSRSCRRSRAIAITDLREQMGTEVTNPALDLEIVDRPFFEALDVIVRKAGVTPYFSTGDGTIGLMAGSSDAKPATPFVQYSGPFRIAVKQIASVRDFQAGSGQRQRAVRGGLGAAAPPDAPGARRRRAEDRRRSRQEDRAAGDERVDGRRAPAREPGRGDQRQPRRPRPCGQDAGRG